MSNSIGIFYSCYKEKRAVDNSIKELRKYYPDSPIYLVSDGGLDFTYLTKKYKNIKVSLEEDTMSDTFKITDVNFRDQVHQKSIKICVKSLLRRLQSAIEFCNTDYILMMDPDALVRGKLTIPDDVKLLGSKINRGFPEGIKNILSSIDGAIVIDSWGATPAIFESKSFVRAISKLTDNLLDRFTNEFYAIYAHDVLLPLLFALIGEEEQYNPDITECNRDHSWKTNNKPLVHQYKERYMKNGMTLVTSLFDLNNVVRTDKRNWDDYLSWFKKTLSINCNFIIFVEPKTVDLIKNIRSLNNTLIIETELSGIPYYHFLDTFQTILDSEIYKNSMKDVSRVECRDAIYSVIQYSKFKWLQEAAVIDPFDTDYFFWVDAGISRFLEPNDYKNKFPSQEAIEQLNNIDDTLLIQYNNDYYTDLTNSHVLPKTYFWDNRSFVCGSMFGGTETAICQISDEIDEIINMMISNKFLNNEQIALGYLTKIREDLFSLFYRSDPSKHLELFTELA